MSTRAGPAQPDVAQHRDYPYRYALLHLRDASRADDVVQETLLAAVESPDRFSGRSSLRTWLTGILKHKIIDVFRNRPAKPRSMRRRRWNRILSPAISCRSTPQPRC